MQIVISRDYEFIRDWIESIPRRFEYEGSSIYKGRNEVRLLKAPNNMPVCIKKYCCPNPIKRVIYTYFRSPKAVRAYNNATTLFIRGIESPAPIAYLIEYKHGLIGESYLLTRYCEYTRNFYEFRHHPLEGYENIVKDFARFSARMHNQCVYHKDYSPGNIIFDVHNGRTDFSIIDINRMIFPKEVTMTQGCKNFARLWGKEDFFLLLAEEYAKCRGFDVKECQRLVVKYWKRFWRFRK